MFRRKTFSVVKYLQMQMIYRKIFVFPVFVCTLGKCFRKYSILCVWSNVKQINRKYPYPKPPQSTKNEPHCQPATQTHPVTHPATPQPTPQPTQTHPTTPQPTPKPTANHRNSTINHCKATTNPPQ